ncbi:glycosyltransferase family 4 protein [Caballeronia sp. LZ008]|uniref:glycosyltransferase family 4 protein n=1 Tax=unclassified Caballeronia TaxID=2646786 RepID=UPI0020294B73|nr:MULTISPECIES: glycosyltransferase family 4 protein [unclassified Caballeronia]MDR5794998.1 glycosyltransferase family 4 protein [Caballeronia sp. LZ008]
MKIAQVAPLYESVPPKAYGATERVVSALTEQLVAWGHDVTLFAAGDSKTQARLRATHPVGLWRDERVWDTTSHHLRQLDAVVRRSAQFDLVHFHGEPFHLPLQRYMSCPSLTTVHGRLLVPDHGPLYEAYPDAPLVSISDSQRKDTPHANWIGTVHHGLPLDAMRFSPNGGDYLLFVGRMMPEKGIERAVEIARRAGLPLKIAAAVHPGERAWFREEIYPMLEASQSFVEYLGEVGGETRLELFSHARALMFPIGWEEPFGLVLIEAMASGTPAIAFRRGAVPEIVEHGVTGFIVDDVEQAVRAVQKLGTIRRNDCRRSFERRFSAERMTRDYLAIYRTLLADPARGGEEWAPGDPMQA